jgi:hypothetical protein
VRRLGLLATLLAALVLAAPAQAEFGLHDFEVAFSEFDGSPVTQAGAHPYEMTTTFSANTKITGKGKEIPFEPVKDVLIEQVEGFAGNPSAAPVCSTVDFLADDGQQQPSCPDGSAVGKIAARVTAPAVGASPFLGAVYLLQPPPGAPAKLGFWIVGVPVTVDVSLTESPPYRIVGASRDISQILSFYGAELTLWGIPGDPRHDTERGHCVESGANKCHVEAKVPFLTMPRACGGPLATDFSADSWLHPGAFVSGSGSSPPIVGCDKLPFGPTIDAQPTARAAQSPSGLDFTLEVEDEGLVNPEPGALAASDIEQAVVTLPRGMTINASQAEGLAVCTVAQLEAESADAAPDEGCPQASKVGTIAVQTPLLKGETLPGSLYVAEPYHNLAGDSLIAVYAVIRDPELGVSVSQPIRVEPDPVTGQLIGIAEGMPDIEGIPEGIPQVPFSSFRLHFREGGRSPLITPPGCGTFETEADLFAYSRPEATPASADFQVVSGPGGSPCPTGSAPFAPRLEAGTEQNAAKTFSPFAMRITRADGEQDLTRVSATLPAGVAGILAGLSRCPDAAIEAARARTGPQGGHEELQAPSCPASSRIGHTVAGAGAGAELTYVDGSLYLAGPYKGAPLSVVSITPAVAGPFDAGTVVVRFGLSLDPKTGEVQVDGSASDPIPHILKGIPLNVRDLRAFTDRPDFTFNASGCSERHVRATLWGGGTALAPARPSPITRGVPYRAAGCGRLGFKPSLSIRLLGGTRRGQDPALHAVLRPRPHDANLSGAAVTLPRSAFLDQSHIRTVCTRVQFAAAPGNGAQCPAGSVYGHATAYSPILEEPATGPVFLRSSNHNLPDLVIALKGPPSAAADVEVSARIDSVRGGIRARFENTPDLPVSRFILAMQGGKKGLIVNSTDLCRNTHRAHADLSAQNGRSADLHPVVAAAKCSKKKSGKRR